MMYNYNYLNNLRGFINKTDIVNAYNYILENKPNLQSLNLNYIYYNLNETTIQNYLINQNIIDIIKNSHNLLYFNGTSMFENIQLNYNIDINSFFDGCLKLRQIIIKNMFKNNQHTLNIQLNSMFKNFLYLELIDLENLFINNKGTLNISCKEMFENCKNLKFINLNNMFNNIELLEEIDFTQMFSECISLEYLNFNNFIINNNNLKTFTITNIFKNCYNLKCIFLLNSCTTIVEQYKYMNFTIPLKISLDIDEYGIDQYEKLTINSFNDAIIRSLCNGSILYISYLRENENTIKLEYYNPDIEIISIKNGYLYKKYKLTITTSENEENIYIYNIIENLEEKKQTFLESIIN